MYWRLQLRSIVASCFIACLFLMVAFVAMATACEGGGGGGGCTVKPTVATKAASSITYNSAYINGEVNPNGCETTYYFEFRKSGGTFEKASSARPVR